MAALSEAAMNAQTGTVSIRAEVMRMSQALCACETGGLPQPGPIFQALPQPLPLPELPQPQRPAEFQAEAPESAPSALPQPGAQLQAHHHRANQYIGTVTRKLQQAGPLDGPPGTLPEPAQPFAAEAPHTAPGQRRHPADAWLLVAPKPAAGLMACCPSLRELPDQCMVLPEQAASPSPAPPLRPCPCRSPSTPSRSPRRP